MAGLPEECIKPVILEILFVGGENKVFKKDDMQLSKIADFLKKNPQINIELIGNTSDSKKIGLDEQTTSGKVEEVIETEYIPSGGKTCRDLMMIRAYRVRMLFEDLGVNKAQLHPKAGKNLGAGDNNKKVILNYF